MKGRPKKTWKTSFLEEKVFSLKSYCTTRGDLDHETRVACGFLDDFAHPCWNLTFPNTHQLAQRLNCLLNSMEQLRAGGSEKGLASEKIKQGKK